jgi:hypothetical protein
MWLLLIYDFIPLTLTLSRKGRGDKNRDYLIRSPLPLRERVRVRGGK